MAFTRRPAFWWAALLLAIPAILGAAVGIYATVFHPSEIYKRLPHPPLEHVVLSVTATGWERPEGMVIRDCRIRGAIRVLGLGRNGEAPEVRESSHREAHTRRAQEASAHALRKNRGRPFFERMLVTTAVYGSLGSDPEPYSLDSHACLLLPNPPPPRG